jgi:aminoglycoside 2''-phosphotransferase
MNTDTYKQIVEACFPRLRVRDVATLSEGWDSVALEINGEYIFRFPKRPDVEPQYAKEALLLAALADNVPAPIPRFEFVWAGGAAYGMRFVGYRKLGGVPLHRGGFAAAQLAELAGRIAAFLSALHCFPAERAEQLLVPGGDAAQWRLRYRELYQQVCEHALPLLGEPTRSRAARLWESFLDADVYFRFRPALIHCDLGADHILCDPSRAALSGVIDWGDAMIGDPALDFVGLLCDCGVEFVEQALAAYQGELDATFRRRMRFYRYAIPFHEILFGVATGIQAHVQQGVASLRLALADDDGFGSAGTT